jgi:hypothetical protein
LRFVRHADTLLHAGEQQESANATDESKAEHLGLSLEVANFGTRQYVKWAKSSLCESLLGARWHSASGYKEAAGLQTLTRLSIVLMRFLGLEHIVHDKSEYHADCEPNVHMLLRLCFPCLRSRLWGER